jgi:hypothetical protein
MKVLAALALFAGAVTLAWGGWQKTQPTAAINNGNTGEGWGGANRNEMQREVAKEVGITPAQQEELRKVRESGDWRATREASERILTQEQRDRMRDVMMARMAERDKKMQAMLSEADYKALRERRGRGGRGGFGGRPGGPGGDQGPPRPPDQNRPNS